MKLKGMVYKTVIAPALLYGAETWATTRGQEARLEVNEMRMVSWMCRVTRSEMNTLEGQEWCKRPRNSHRKTTREDGHVMRIKGEHAVRMLDVNIPGKEE